MTIYKYRAITMADIPAMAELLLSRQALESNTFPFLQNGCLNRNYSMDILEKLLTSGNVTGTGAFAEDELVGYMIGEIRVDSSRGRHIWVPYEGMAVREDQSPELMRTLYAEVSAMWLKQGCFMHYAMVPLGNQAYFDAFQRLSFFIQQVHGVMNLEEYHPFPQSSDAEVRIADKTDREKMGRLSGIIQSYQNLAPVFEVVLPEVAEEIKAGYKSILEESGLVVLLAEKHGEEQGFQIYETAAPSLMSPDNSTELSVTGTYPCRMGEGIGKKLMNEGCILMREQGIRYMTADWRITNLASSTFWPKCRFKPVAYRMVRYIDKNWGLANFYPK